MSAGFMARMRSVPQLVSQTIPSNATPSPKCARAGPNGERGSPRARAHDVANGSRSRPVRSMRSVAAPAMT